MSTETQVKKRRDNKRKRKDDVAFEEKDSTPQEPVQAYNIPKSTLNGDLNIHVHKEASTGGGLCAKLIFFVLLAMLTALVALLFSEHRDIVEVTYNVRHSKLVKRSIDELAVSIEESELTGYDIDAADKEENMEVNSEESNDSIDMTEDVGDQNMEVSEEDHDDIAEESKNVSPDETRDLSEEISEEQDNLEDDNEQGELDDEEDEIDSENKPELLDDSKEYNGSSGDEDNSENNSKDADVEAVNELPPEKKTPSKNGEFQDAFHDKENYHSLKINQDESESENDRESDGPQTTYQFADTPNVDDWLIKEQLDHANWTLKNE